MRWIYALLIAIILWLAADGYNGRQEAARQRENLIDQTTYLCSTTSVLDSLVVAASDQIQLNFDNGTYKRLRAQGTLTRANLRAARETLEQYRAAHLILSRTTPCKEVEG